MHLKEGETILRVYHHHPTPFVLDVLKVIAGAFPFYLVLFSLQGIIPTFWYVIVHIVIFVIFALVIVYVSLVFWLDRLVVTDQRVLFIDYKYLTKRDDSSVAYDEVSDILTKEKGLLSYFRIFDYGTFILDSPSSYISIIFEDAPNPEGIRQFIYQQMQKRA